MNGIDVSGFLVGNAARTSKREAERAAAFDSPDKLCCLPSYGIFLPGRTPWMAVSRSALRRPPVVRSLSAAVFVVVVLTFIPLGLDLF